MGDLTLNKILGTLLAAALVIFGLRELAHGTFAPPSHYHGDDHGEEKSLNEQLAERFAYYVEIADAGGGAEEEEEVFDLGLALASADVSRGERSFVGKCSTCHTIDDGGSNGTGPNLWAIMGAEKNNMDGFNYSGALEATAEGWSYQNMNDWLYNPSAYASGTSMAFAGLRRDDERANVIAYLASMTPNAPAFPDPIPAEAPEIDEASLEAEGDMQAVDAEPAVMDAAPAAEEMSDPGN